MTQIISIVGPESCGKTTLALALAERFDAPWVEEYARAYLSGRPGYDETDLEVIAKGQLALEQGALNDAPPVLVLDTDMLVIEIWWRERYARVPDWVEAAMRSQPSRAYLLARPDLAWEPDPLREAQFDRERLFAVYRDALAERGQRSVSWTEWMARDCGRRSLRWNNRGSSRRLAELAARRDALPSGVRVPARL